MVPTSSIACQDLAWLIVVVGPGGRYIARSASFGTEERKPKFIWVKQMLSCCLPRLDMLGTHCIVLAQLHACIRLYLMAVNIPEIRTHLQLLAGYPINYLQPTLSSNVTTPAAYGVSLCGLKLS